MSGQAVVFVVRTASWSLMSVAGSLTYIAFFGAQVLLATFIFDGCHGVTGSLLVEASSVLEVVR